MPTLIITLAFVKAFIFFCDADSAIPSCWDNYFLVILLFYSIKIKLLFVFLKLFDHLFVYLLNLLLYQIFCRVVYWWIVTKRPPPKLAIIGSGNPVILQASQIFNVPRPQESI